MITTFRSGVHHTDGLLSAKYAAVHCQKVDGQQWRRIAHKKRILDEQRIERWTSRMLSARSTPELHALNVLRCKLGALLVYTTFSWRRYWHSGTWLSESREASGN